MNMGFRHNDLPESKNHLYRVQMIWGVEVTEIHVGKECSQASVLDTVEVLYLDTEEV